MKIVNKFSISSVVIVLLIGIAIVYFTKPTEMEIILHDIGQTHLVGNYQVQIKLQPEKPKIGNNQLTIAILDGKGLPVTEASIEAYAEMPAMGSMQAMREVVSIENSGSGFYQGSYSLPMNGSWPLSVTIETAKQGKAEALFDMNTSRTGVKLIQATPSELSLQPSQTSVPEQKLETFNVDSYRRQLIGVTTAKVVRQKIIKTIHAGARVTYDQTRLTDISLKYDAWIGKLNADYLGKKIRKGETLFTVYSPELVSAQDEYLDGLRHSRSQGLRKAARKRLTRWGVNTAQIKALQQRGRATDYLPIVSPVKGTIIEKNIVAGSAVKTGSTMLRLADLSTVWVEGEVYEFDLPWLKIGMAAQITVQEHSYTEKVIFIDSVLNLKTRSALVRVQLDNASGLLRPGMFANMNLQVDLGERLVVPEQAIIFSGDQRIVFVDKGNDRLLPCKIKTGVRNENMIEVVDGLKLGDVIVTSGNFLIAAESKLKAGLAQW